MNQKEYEAIIASLIELVDEGVHVVDARGISVIYSEAISVLEKMRREDVLGERFHIAFSHIPEEESTLLRALKNGEATKEKVQTFLNLYGKEVTTVNTTVPIKVDGEIVAAMEVAKDLTKLKEMSDTLLKLQEEYIDPPKVSQPKIRHYNFYDLVGNHPLFQKNIEIARKASQNCVPVFIYGETGTGKELFAQSIHYDGKRKKKPFLAQNCAAIPESLLEGILFGTVKGGFTGAVDRAGLFEQANGGTLLLDEVSAMPYELQSKLLRVLQEDYIRRVGGNRDIPVDVRIIATVNEDPMVLIEKGALRKDLYYRLSVINLNLPPLRQRREDIPLLTERLVEKQCRRMEKRVGGITEEAIKKLEDHEYPGNIRELENIIMSAVSMVREKEQIREEHILLNTREMQDKNKGRLNRAFDMHKETLREYLRQIETELVSQVMKETGQNVTVASERLGMKRQTLQHKLKKMG